MTGEAGVDRRGAWIADADTGTFVRLGEVGYDIAAAMADAGHARAAREALSRPRIGFTIRKEF